MFDLGLLIKNKLFSETEYTDLDFREQCDAEMKLPSPLSA